MSDIASQYHLCSASRHHVLVPHYRLLCRRPDHLELSTCQSLLLTYLSRDTQQQQLQATTEYGLLQLLLSTLCTDSYSHFNYQLISIKCCKLQTLCYIDVQLTLIWHWQWKSVVMCKTWNCGICLCFFSLFNHLNKCFIENNFTVSCMVAVL